MEVELDEMREIRVGRCFSRVNFQRISLTRSGLVDMESEWTVWGEVRKGSD